MRTFLLGLLFCSMILNASAENITHTVYFDHSKLQVDTVIGGGNSYSSLSYNDMEEWGAPSYPSIPTCAFTVQIPLYADNVTVSCTPGMHQHMQRLPFPLIPVQEIYSTNAVEYPFTEPDSVAYSSMGMWPEEAAFYQCEGLLDGNIRLLTVRACPIRYVSRIKDLWMYDSLVVNISYDIVEAQPSNFTLTPLARQTTASVGRNQVISNNHQFLHIDSLIPTPRIEAVFPTIQSLVKGYEYTIITCDSLSSAFERLAALHRHLGRNVGIVTMEEIRSIPLFRRGDPVSNINDDAGILRAYLIYAYEHLGTQYVLLGGKPPIVPMRYGQEDGYEIDGSIPQDFEIPSDMYFSDLNSNWNHNGISGKYGFENDSLDYYPELYVGRLLCRTVADVNNYIDKVERYTFNPGNGDASYLMKRAATCISQMTTEETFVSKELDDIITDYLVIRQSGMDFPTGAYVIEQLNNFPHGYLSLYGHGNPMGITVCHKDYQSLGINALDAEHKWIKDEVGNGLDCITNIHMPNIVYSTSCTTMPYDIYSNYECTWNIGESLINGKKYGSVAYLGNTRYGWSKNIGSAYIERKFYYFLKYGYKSIGMAEAMSKAPAYSSGLSVKHSHWIRLTHNLLGDPRLEAWMVAPSSYKNVTERNSISGNYLISSDFVNSKYITVPLAGGQLGEIESSSSTIRLPSIQNPEAVVILKDGFLPYLTPLRFYGISLSGEGIFYCKELNIGKNRSDSTSFESGANYTFLVEGDTELYTLTIADGAVVTIKSQGEVSLNDIILEVGGVLNIECDSITSIMNNRFYGELNINVND